MNPNVVLVLFSNYPYAINQAQEKIPAILWSATGSQDMGTAMAEALFGLHAPAGRLNMTWYLSDDQLPDIDDYDIIQGKRTYRYFDGEVLYPFGYGLTYTTFTYSELAVELVDCSKLKVTFRLKNTGEVKSDEVVQVYGIAPPSRIKKPIKQLLGFQRVKDMQPGESRWITLFLLVSELQFYDVISKTMMVEDGEYQIAVGPSSNEFCQCVQIHIPGKHTGLRDMTVRTAADHYDEYENVYLTEGQFGYVSATALNNAKMGRLIYKDCRLTPEYKTVILHLKSEKEGMAEVYLNGKRVADFKEETKIYKDVRLTFANPIEKVEETVVLENKLNEKVNLCYFRLE